MVISDDTETPQYDKEAMYRGNVINKVVYYETPICNVTKNKYGNITHVHRPITEIHNSIEENFGFVKYITNWDRVSEIQDEFEEFKYGVDNSCRGVEDRISYIEKNIEYFRDPIPEFLDRYAVDLKKNGVITLPPEYLKIPHKNRWELVDEDTEAFRSYLAAEDEAEQ